MSKTAALATIGMQCGLTEPAEWKRRVRRSQVPITSILTISVGSSAIPVKQSNGIGTMGRTLTALPEVESTMK